MNSVSQWVHQHNILVILALVLGTALAVLMRYRRRSIRLWVAWSVALGLSVAVVLSLRTPNARLSEYVGPANHEEFSESALASVEEIKSLLSRGGKHTLVEIYADFGVG